MSEQIPVKDVTPDVQIQQPDPRKSNSFNPRNRIYVRAVQGLYQRLRQRMGFVMLGLFLLLPWVPYGGRQGILLDIADQKFQLFGLTLMPQDFTLVAYLFMLAAFSLFFVTTFLGRVWCGYMCPQTVWTFLFIWFEEKFEGTANQRKKLDQSPWNFDKAWRKAAKHLGWLAVALLTSLTFVAYFVPARELFPGFFTLQAGGWTSFAVIFFAFCTYGNAGWMREIMCTHICPYARFQSVMFDKDTFIVGYDPRRGEPRGPRSRKQDHKALGLGDCIDCQLCVQVCPTGIDIRNGLQYECINCGACIDACDGVMDKMGYPRKLISYTTEHQLSGGKTHVARPKLIGYGAVMAVMLGLFVLTLATRSLAQLDVVRDRNALYRETNEGLIENSYTLKVLNKDAKVHDFVLKVKGLPADAQWNGDQHIQVAPGELATLPISLVLDPADLKKPITDIHFQAQAADDPGIQADQDSRFFGPH
ncbi:cytochrome c oxidase accessory protein CcoG [Gallaecimonas kandeliae]|uniref:cytochrome c oxidase accessory protein CcoG n=1 Tax=Gallaecimonas kandeliae TaxID=3029055 RepID=UPI002648F780|nr:cytochrome c oxidase accessory protein CcoG [Gallaecimonas kandeliae]WKE65619.1 cytochrome c oxidase accessory protein CcoG [Gallaecimonas kandeliae]